MTGLWLALIITSIVGAVAFFAAGTAFGRARGSRPSVRAGDGDELLRLRAHHAQILDDHRRLGDEVARLAGELRATAPLSSRISQLEHELTETQRRLTESHHRLTDVQQRLVDAQQRLTAAQAAPPPAPAPAPPPLPPPSLPTAPLTARIAQLEHALAESQRRLAAAPPPAPPRQAGGAALAATMSTGGLDGVVRQLQREAGVSTAVVSDELGLLVAGGGARAEELAALGGYLAGVGERTRQLAALGPPSRITVEDEAGALLSATHLPGGLLVAVTVRGAA